MEIVGEKITLVADARKGEMVILMGGFRVTLSGEEAQLLGDVIARGLDQLYPGIPDEPPPDVRVLLQSDLGWRDKLARIAGERHGDVPGPSDRQPGAPLRKRIV